MTEKSTPAPKQGAKAEPKPKADPKPKAAKSDDDQILVAKESFSGTVDGQNYVVNRGQTRVRASHPLVAANPAYWEPVDLSLTYEIEQATAAPGEKRGQ